MLRNRLLDEVGSDHKPLVNLLLKVHEAGIPLRLPPVATDSRQWEAQRAALTAQVVNELFVQQEMATWAIESWAWALHVIDERLLTIAPPPKPAPPPPQPPPARASARSGGPSPSLARTSSRPAVSTPRVVPALPSRSAPAPIPRAVFRAMNALSVATIAAGIIYIGYAAVTRPATRIEPVAAVQSAPSPGAPAAIGGVTAESNTRDVNGQPGVTLPPAPENPGIPSLTRSALPMTAADSEKLLVVAPARRAQFSNDQPGARTPNLGVSALDQLDLRDGRHLRGRVEVIRASTIQFRDADTGLRYEFAKRDVVTVTTEFGTTVRFDGGEPAAKKQGALLKRGLGGEYTVHYTVTTVKGTKECASLWKQNPPDDRVTVRHTPGADTLQLVFHGGATFNGVLDEEARFATTFVIARDQQYTSTALTTRLQGQFTARGFDGEVNIIAYRRARPGAGDDTTCQSVLAATAVRDSGVK